MWRKLPENLKPHQYRLWTEFTPLALKHKAVNLGQGYPNFSCPAFVKTSLTLAVENDENQYCPPSGFEPLKSEISEFYSKKYNHLIDPSNEVAVTYGATEALLLAAMALLNPGDEVVMLDPCFDLYQPQVELVGGKAVRVSLNPPVDSTSPWTIDFEKLEKAFNSRTRGFFFNTPNNPIAKVMTSEELDRLAFILRKWPDVAVVADEVYEHVLFDGREHVSLCAFEGMWDRTLTLSSAGKIFSITGWKTGWAVGGADIIKKVNLGKLWTSYCSNTVCQGAIARALKVAENEYQGFPSYYQWIRNEYQGNRDKLLKILKFSNRVRLSPLLSEGGFFLCARILDGGEFIPHRFRQNGSLDFAFCRWSTEELKLSAIPCSAFFSEKNKAYGEGIVRFALCKDRDDYEKAEKILMV